NESQRAARKPGRVGGFLEAALSSAPDQRRISGHQPRQEGGGISQLRIQRPSDRARILPAQPSQPDIRFRAGEETRIPASDSPHDGRMGGHGVFEYVGGRQRSRYRSFTTRAFVADRRTDPPRRSSPLVHSYGIDS